ncbi:MAG: protoporphyrinogen/coproporphyrinogen oxidase, partial [Vicinamibacterales bacterium]
RTLTAVTWTSNKFGGRVPDGVALLRAFVGRAGNERPAYLVDEELIPLVRAELHAILGIDAEPLLARVYRWPRGMPQYNLGHQELLAGIAERLAGHPRLALTGAAFRGVGIPDCISDATTQANALADRICASVPVNASCSDPSHTELN